MCEYVVSIDDAGLVRALSSHTGRVLAGAKNASLVIQAAIDNLPVEGGKIYLAAGRYDLDATVRIEDKHGVHLEGAARGIVFSGGQEGTVLRSDRAIDLIEVFGNRLKVAGVSLSNLHVVGSSKRNGRAGVLVRGNSDLLSIHNVGANHCGVGFHLQGGGGDAPGVIDAPQLQFCDPQVNGVGLKIERCHYAKVVAGEFSDCDRFGIAIASPDAGEARAQGIKILAASAVRNGQAGAWIGSNAEDITIAGGGDFAGTHHGAGITVSGVGDGSLPRNVIISGVHCYNNRLAGISLERARHVVVQGSILSAHEHVAVDDSGQEYGIRIGRGTASVIVQGNIVYGNRKGAILDETGNALVTDNIESPRVASPSA